MSFDKERVAIVANDPNNQVHAKLSQIFRDNWITGEPINDIDGFWDAFESTDVDPTTGETLADGLNIFIALDTFYNPAEDPAAADYFIQTLGGLADQYLVGIINLGHAEAVKSAFRRYAQENGIKGDIYFIDPKGPARSFEAAAEAYNKRQQLSSGAAANVTGEIGDVDVSKNAFIFTVTSAKGGTGKSTVSQLLASQIALGSKAAGSPLKVAVVDMDTYDSQLGFVINQMRPTALNIKASGDLGPKAIAANLIFADMLGVHCLLAPIRGSNADDVDAAFYTPVVKNLRAMFDIVILDTSVQYHDELIPNVCFKQSDGIIYVTDQDIKSVGGMSRWMRHVTGPVDKGGYGIKKENIVVVINKALSGNVNMSLDQIRTATSGSRILGAIPADIGSFISATNTYSIASLLTDSPTVSEAYFQLAKSILGEDKPLARLYEGAGV